MPTISSVSVRWSDEEGFLGILLAVATETGSEHCFLLCQRARYFEVPNTAGIYCKFLSIFPKPNFYAKPQLNYKITTSTKSLGQVNSIRTMEHYLDSFLTRFYKWIASRRAASLNALQRHIARFPSSEAQRITLQDFHFFAHSYLQDLQTKRIFMNVDSYNDLNNVMLRRKFR